VREKDIIKISSDLVNGRAEPAWCLKENLVFATLLKTKQKSSSTINFKEIEYFCEYS
jgi:hypothetical protein